MEKLQKAFKNFFTSNPQKTKPEWRQWIEAILIAVIAAFLLRNFLFGLYHVPTGSAEPTILVGDRIWGNKLAYRFGNKVQRGDLVIFDQPNFKYDKSRWIHNMWQKWIGFEIPLLGLQGGPINVTKRIIAIPGDWIEGKIENNKPIIYLNNKKLEEPYVNPYPLIWLKKSSGFIQFDSIGPLPIPSFLKRTYKSIRYTYDPEKPFDQQPFYNMDKSEVIRIPGFHSLWHPYTPTYKDFEETENADVFGPIQIPEGKCWGMGDNRKGSEDSRWFGLLDQRLIQGRISFIVFSVDSEESFWLFELIKHPIDFWFNSVRWNRFFKKPQPITKEK